MLSLQEKKINDKISLLHTKHKAENSAVWTVYVKYGLKGLEIWVWKSV